MEMTAIPVEDLKWRTTGRFGTKKFLFWMVVYVEEEGVTSGRKINRWRPAVKSDDVIRLEFHDPNWAGIHEAAVRPLGAQLENLKEHPEYDSIVTALDQGRGGWVK